MRRRMHQPAPSSWTQFLRLWFILGFAYFLLRFLFNMAVMGWIDIRPSAFLDLVVVPLGQTIVLWVVTRRARRDADRAVADGPRAAGS